MSLGDMYSVHNHVFFFLSWSFEHKFSSGKGGLWEPDMFTHRSCNDVN